MAQDKLRGTIGNIFAGTLRRKLAFYFMGSVLMLVVVAIAAYLSLRSVAGSADHLAAMTTEIEEVGNLQLALFRVIMPANDYLITGDVAERETFAQLTSDVQEHFARVKGLELSEEEKAVVGGVEKEFEKVREMSLKILDLSDPVGNRTGGELMEQVDAEAERLTGDVEKLHDMLHAEVSEAIAHVNTARTRTSVLLLVLSSVAVIAGIGFTVLMSGRIAEPILSMTGLATRLAEGDLRERISVQAADEMGRLADAFNRMVESLSGVVKEIQGMSSQVSGATSEILATTEQQERTFAQQSSSVNETASTVEELVASAKQIEESAAHALGQVESSSERTSMLNERTQQIGRITEAIEGIAQKINLLALNASIEAARAGEQGRGFGVLASEIRRLADDTGRSTEEIRGLIEDVQEASNAAVMSSEQVVDSVRRIRLSVEQQGVATDQIGVAMREISGGMGESADGIKQTVAAVEELNAMAQQMRSLVEGFKVA